MSEVTGFIVGLIVAERAGIFKKYMGNGKKTENGTYDPGVKPKCQPGYYAYRNPQSGNWSCRSIPTGR